MKQFLQVVVAGVSTVIVTILFRTRREQNRIASIVERIRSSGG